MSQYDLQEQAIQRQRMIAAALRDSGNIPDEALTRTAGRYVVPVSPWQAFGKLLNTAAGTYGEYKADKEAEKLQKKKKDDAEEWMSGLSEIMSDPLEPATTSVQYEAPTDPTPADMSALARQMRAHQAGRGAYQEARDVTNLVNKSNLAAQYMKGMQLGGMPAALSQQGLEREMKPPEMTKLGEGDVLVNSRTGAEVARGLEKTYKPAAEDRALVNVVDPSSPKGYRTIPRAEWETQGRPQLYEKPTVAAELANGLTGNALDMAAERYRLTGEMPSGLGRSPAAVQKVLNRASERAALAGDDAGAASIRQQQNKAARAGLLQLQKQKVMVSAFEKTALLNLQIANDLSGVVDRTNVPMLNRWVLATKRELTNNPDLRKFDNAIETFTAEYAKIMSGSMGNTQLSDSARQHAREMLKAADTPEAFKAVADLLKQEMRNRMTGFDEEMTELNSSLGGGTKITAPTPGNAQPISGIPTDVQSIIDKYKTKP